MRARLIQEVGVRGRLRIYWERRRVVTLEPCDHQDCGPHPTFETVSGCPNAFGPGRPGPHNAYAPIGEVGAVHPIIHAEDLFGAIESFAAERWPTACALCGEAVPPAEEMPTVIGAEAMQVTRQVFADRLYNTPSGIPELGDLYYASWMHHGPAEKCFYWDNCDGRHLHAVLPDGHHWDIDSRAANCDMKADRTHRCWVKTGSAEAGDLSVGKGGVTCGAGAGSIDTGTWHGFLTKMDMHT